MPGNISGYDRDIYHLLCGALGQSVAVTKVVDFNVLDIIAVGHVNVAIQFRRSVGARRCGFRNRGLVTARRQQVTWSVGHNRPRIVFPYRALGRRVHLLQALAGLDLGLDLRCGCGCTMVNNDG